MIEQTRLGTPKQIKAVLRTFESVLSAGEPVLPYHTGQEFRIDFETCEEEEFSAKYGFPFRGAFQMWAIRCHSLPTHGLSRLTAWYVPDSESHTLLQLILSELDKQGFVIADDGLPIQLPAPDSACDMGGNGQPEDDRARYARLAVYYSRDEDGDIRPETIELWERIAELKRIPLTHNQIAARLSLTTSGFKYHWYKMKRTGYWRSVADRKD